MPGDPAAQRHVVHVVILYPLMGGEGIRRRSRADTTENTARRESESYSQSESFEKIVFREIYTKRKQRRKSQNHKNLIQCQGRDKDAV
jgi:hypothetical protein